MNEIINLIREEKTRYESSSYVGGSLIVNILNDLILEAEKIKDQSVNVKFLENNKEVGNISVNLDGDLNEPLINLLRDFSKDYDLDIKILEN